MEDKKKLDESSDEEKPKKAKEALALDDENEDIA